MSRYTKKSDTVPEKYFHIDVAGHAKVHKATVFARLVDGTWHASVAFCAHGDTFSRRLGRQIARRRFFNELNEWKRDADYSAKFLFELLDTDVDYQAAENLVQFVASKV